MEDLFVPESFEVPHAHAWSGFHLEPLSEQLVRHAKDFRERTGFSYSILDGDDVIGCIYIYPSCIPGG